METPKGWTQTEAYYNPMKSTLTIKVASTEILPNFLYYWLQSKRIPVDSFISFTDKTVYLKRNSENSMIYKEI